MDNTLKTAYLEGLVSVRFLMPNHSIQVGNSSKVTNGLSTSIAMLGAGMMPRRRILGRATSQYLKVENRSESVGNSI